jgi:hypothetical protein
MQHSPHPLQLKVVFHLASFAATPLAFSEPKATRSAVNSHPSVPAPQAVCGGARRCGLQINRASRTTKILWCGALLRRPAPAANLVAACSANGVSGQRRFIRCWRGEGGCEGDVQAAEEEFSQHSLCGMQRWEAEMLSVRAEWAVLRLREARTRVRISSRAAHAGGTIADSRCSNVVVEGLFAN